LIGLDFKIYMMVSCISEIKKAPEGA
jgi:hypothetical protein